MPKNKQQEIPRNTVIIAGGGWSGLASAIELSRHQIPVILLESAKQPGGRARGVHIDNLRVDNGQHMLIGAYESTLHLLRTIGVKESNVLKRQPLSLQWLNPNGRSVTLRTPRLPAPLHLAWGLLTASGLPLKDRLSALAFSKKLSKMKFSIKEDCSVESLLNEHNQSSTITKTIWEPLCLGALNTQINEASAKIFLRTLSDSFNHTRKDSDLLLTRKDLGAIFPEPAVDYIEKNKGSVRLGQRVIDISIDNHSVSGVSTEDGQLKSQYVILATPSPITKKLIEKYDSLDNVTNQIQHIQHRPICTVYLQYPEHIKLGRWLHGSVGTVTQWIFDRRLYGQNGLMSVVVSSNGEHMEWDNDKLCETIKAELATHFPRWPEPVSCHVIREKRATFASTVDINQYRPDTKTSVNGLYLAGDYTNIGLPGTLEGAVRSGIQCAQHIIQHQLRHK